MNPSENEFREVLRHRDAPEGFAERVLSRAAQANASSRTAAPFRSRLVTSAAIIAIAVILVAGAGLLITRCASACSIGGSSSELPRLSTHEALVADGGGHVLGPLNGAVVLEEYGDYECPACGDYFPIIEELLHRFPDQIRFEFHHFPLVAIHHNAMSAAMAAEAAGEQNHFWEMHRILFLRQKEWARAGDPEMQFAAYAEEIGLDLDRFRQSLKSPAIEQRITSDIRRAQDARFSGTPTFRMNGTAVQLPATVNTFSALIRTELGRTK
jgi:protein-disulfide isomerase